MRRSSALALILPEFFPERVKRFLQFHQRKAILQPLKQFRERIQSQAFVREHEVVLASAKGLVPRLTEAIAGEHHHRKGSTSSLGCLFVASENTGRKKGLFPYRALELRAL
jgi:hypothetical protein